jgi:hypothetical protein
MAKEAALRACASDESAAAFADELFHADVVLPLSLPCAAPGLLRRSLCRDVTRLQGGEA